MTSVRIAHAEPRLDERLDGSSAVRHVLVVLADEPGHRAMGLWLRSHQGRDLLRVRHRPGRGTEPPGPAADPPADGLPARGSGPEDLAVRPPSAARGTATGVDIDELGPGVLAAHIGVTGPAGTRQGHRAPRRPQNLMFGDGLDGWMIGGGFQAEVTGAHRHDYTATAAGGVATVAAAVPRPYSDAFIGQAIRADGYRGATVTFSGEVRAENVADHAQLCLHAGGGRGDGGDGGHAESPVITGSRDSDPARGHRAGPRRRRAPPV